MTSEESKGRNRHFVPLSGGRYRFDGAITAWLVLVFFAALLCLTAGNNYPYFYNPQEEQWVQKVIANQPDFQQPLLLFTVTRAAKDLFHLPDDPQSVVLLGRTISALFGASAIICLCLTIYFIQGSVSAVIASLLLLGQHLLFELSHIMVPETSLFFGLSLAFLGLVLFEQEPTILWSLFLGIGVAIAASARTIGILMVFPALFIVLRDGRRELRLRRRLQFALGFFFALLVLNFSAVVRFPTFSQKLFAHVSHALTTMNVHNGFYTKAMLENLTPFIWAMLCMAPVVVWIRRREISCSVKVVLLFPLVFFAILLVLRDHSEARLLPVVGFLYVIAVSAVQASREFIPIRDERLRDGFSLALTLLCGAALLSEAFVGIPYYRAFNRDDRQEMLDWMSGNLAPGTKVIADSNALLPELMARTADTYPFILLHPLLEHGSEGSKLPSEVDYAVVSGPALSAASATATSEDGESPFGEHGALIWERASDKVPVIHPGLRIYKIARTAEQTKTKNAAKHLAAE